MQTVVWNVNKKRREKSNKKAVSFGHSQLWLGFDNHFMAIEEQKIKVTANRTAKLNDSENEGR